MSEKQRLKRKTLRLVRSRRFQIMKSAEQINYLRMSSVLMSQAIRTHNERIVKREDAGRIRGQIDEKKVDAEKKHKSKKV